VDDDKGDVGAGRTLVAIGGRDADGAGHPAIVVDAQRQSKFFAAPRMIP
jgi:hypothetical protein